MLRSKYVGLVLAATLMATLIPLSAMVYAQSSEEKRAEKFVELAERAREKVDNFIKIIYANDTAIDTITDAGLYDELDANKTLLFETWGLGNLTEAHEALKADPPDYPGAIGNATEALSVFREVFKALNTILTEAGVARGQLIDAQGLIEAMKRALDRIERVRGVEGVPDEVLKILDSAEDYLDIETAIEWLSEGKINQTAWNLTQANRLISQASVSLKKAAGALNSERIRGFLTVITKFYNRTTRLVDRAVKQGLVDPGEFDIELGDIDDLIKDAEDPTTHIEDAVADLIEARLRLESIQKEISERRRGK